MDARDGLTEANRSVVLEFVELFYHRKNVRQAFEAHVGEDYMQHSPHLPDGREAAIAMLEPKFAAEGSRFLVKRVLVDGDLAVVHLHGRVGATGPGVAVADVFRLAGGKIVEHWDVIQPVPDAAPNPRPMI